MKLVHKLLLLLILAIVAVGAYFYLPARRFIVYNLHVSGDPTTSCCDEKEALQASGAFEEDANIALFDGESIDYPKTSLAASYQTSPDTQVLGTKNAAGESKWIEVSLDQQMLRAWEGNKIVMEFPISSGLWYPTPKGDFAIWHKTRYQRMKGGSKELGTYYDLPNVPNNMFFYRGFAIHGAYWHNNFGQPMSHGCVNAPLAQVAKLFEWAGPQVSDGKNVAHATTENPGTRVFIH